MVYYEYRNLFRSPKLVFKHLYNKTHYTLTYLIGYKLKNIKHETYKIYFKIPNKKKDIIKVPILQTIKVSFISLLINL